MADLETAGRMFQHLIDQVEACPEGSVVASVKAGVCRKDALWLLEQLGRKAVKINSPTVEDVAGGAQKGAIVFFKVPRRKFDHYTVLSPASTATRLELIDSDGFNEILAGDSGWTLKGEPVEIENLYVLAGWL